MQEIIAAFDFKQLEWIPQLGTNDFKKTIHILSKSFLTKLYSLLKDKLQDNIPESFGKDLSFKLSSHNEINMENILNGNVGKEKEQYKSVNLRITSRTSVGKRSPYFYYLSDIVTSLNYLCASTIPSAINRGFF